MERDEPLRPVREFGRRLLAPEREVYVAVGTFDGVHRGHQRVLRRLVQDAAGDGATPCVMTFDPHPLAVVGPRQAPPLLATVPERVRRLRRAGVEHVLTVPFTRSLAAMEPEVFIADGLAGGLGARRVYVGFSFTFGRGARGTPALLRQVGPDYGLEVREFGPVAQGSAVLSSSAIRQALRDGDVEAAWRGLGRPHLLEGHVVEGERRGARLGFPTANLELAGDVLRPADGVYAVLACVGGVLHPGVANLGTRPTVRPGGRRLLEVHLLDFAGDLYGRRLRVNLVARLREERKFPDLDALVAQIRRDAEAAHHRLAELTGAVETDDACGVEA